MWFVCGVLCALVVLSISGTLFDEVRGATMFGRARVTTELVRRGDTAAFELLFRRLRRPAWRASVMASLGDAARQHESLREQIISRPKASQLALRWIAAEVNETDPQRRVRALEIAGALDLPGSVPLVEVCTLDRHASPRVAALEALYRLDADNNEQALLRVLETDGAWAAELLPARLDDEDRATSQRRIDVWGISPALSIVVGSSAESSLGAISAMLVSSEVHSVELGLRALHPPLPAAITDRLLALFGHADERVRRRAIETWARLDVHDGVALVAALVGDPSRTVRREAAIALASCRSGGEAVAVLARSPDSRTSETALTTSWELESVAAW